MKSEYVGNPITKDTYNRKITGVCAGIARHFSLPVWGVRGAVIVFGLFHPGAVIFGYVLASLLMPSKKYF